MRGYRFTDADESMSGGIVTFDVQVCAQCATAIHADHLVPDPLGEGQALTSISGCDYGPHTS